MLKIAIFTEAGGAYGYGHLTKCAAVADGFSAFGFAATIFAKAMVEPIGSVTIVFLMVMIMSV